MDFQITIKGDFFDNLLTILKLEKDDIFFVPGNHDIAIDDPSFEQSRAIINYFGIRELVGQGYLREELLRRFDNYYDFVEKYSSWIKRDSISYTKNINVNGIEVAVVGLNSAWSSNPDSDKENVFIDEKLVIEAFSKIESPQITITLLHYLTSCFGDADAKFREKMINNRSDFVLHGHFHDKVCIGKMPDSVVYYLAAGYTYEDNSLSGLAYNYVSADLESGIADVCLRKFNNNTCSWESDNAYGENGKMQFLLPPRMIEKENSIDFPLIALKKIHFNIEEIQHAEEETSIDTTSLHIPSIPERLLNSIKEGKCVLFAGAGASMDAKIPSWKELVMALVDGLKSEYCDMADEELKEIDKLFNDNNYLVLADYCLKKLGAYDFSEILKSKLSCDGKRSLTHNLLAQIPFKAVITTNFDLFIEQTNSANGRSYKMLLPNEMNVTEEELENVLPIFKIHGTYEDPESIVLTKAGIRELLFNNSAYNETLKRYFVENTVLFYGYSFSDPDIDFILQEIMADKRGMTRKHYALLPNVGEIEREYLLKEYNIQVISYDTDQHGHLAAREFLQKIVQQL